MTISALPLDTLPRGLTYARARLYLGITGVGSAVLLSAAMLYFRIPSQGLSLSSAQPVPAALFRVGLIFAFAPMAFLMFDLIGGAWLVRRREWASTWLTRWLRGVAVQWVVWMLSAAALMLASRAGGTPAAVAVFVVVQLLLAAGRGRMSRVIANLPVVPTPDRIARAATQAGLDVSRLEVVESPDESFVGGWSGLTAHTLVVPARWAQLSDAALTAMLRRRHIIGTSGAHMRGVFGAIGWNTIGFVVALLLTGVSPSSAGGVVTLAAAMTLWAFVGVLLLPTPSRAAVYAIDAAATASTDIASMTAGIEQLDKWQDDEPVRRAGVETVFHPVPGRRGRITRLVANAGAVKAWHAHHLARHALWLSWGACTPLSRAVHCNVGRTALWAMLPGD
ncbi:hypothetical protein [Gemmatimonas groenlandica]|uniref:Uncharacterized protein n=1 Tax=Gemmatimonas groenlandica TaxID=2732249 RepID=A0A6M4IRB7_9BACT|nr:hypothetical protein [Gemmatimonas groenlandica]QJR37464.1 hypothetical protein HKW67_19080 [Gemmatimonas groenlandica]